MGVHPLPESEMRVMGQFIGSSLPRYLAVLKKLTSVTSTYNTKCNHRELGETAARYPLVNAKAMYAALRTRPIEMACTVILLQ
jgi:hypothetical protein